MAIENDWSASHPIHRDVTKYTRTMPDGREIHFHLTCREAREAGSVTAVRTLLTVKAADAIKAWERTREPDNR